MNLESHLCLTLETLQHHLITFGSLEQFTIKLQLVYAISTAIGSINYVFVFHLFDMDSALSKFTLNTIAALFSRN